MEEKEIAPEIKTARPQEEGPLEELAHLADGLQPGPETEESLDDPIDDYEQVKYTAVEIGILSFNERSSTL